MAWHEGLDDDQRTAACHHGSHARLLAGPGTGKTLTMTRRICYLIEEQGADHGEVLALTFTRAAARELRQRVSVDLGPERVPKIFTLHGFALRQLLRNAARVTTLPQPVRIADDWEERHIILEDLKRLLNLDRVERARDLLNELSADWQSLAPEDGAAQQRDTAFIGAWQEHRAIFGYVLRAELVYQLKRALEQIGDFVLEQPIRHLLLDEYQDFNLCDLAVMKAIAALGAEVFIAGDDDQSIYGFRKAHPDGIRRFPTEYTGARDYLLQICKRCDPKILDAALFVARQDYSRIEKPIRAEDGRTGGYVALLRFSTQLEEAEGVAQLCRFLIEEHGLRPNDILILVRGDYRQAFSSVLRQALNTTGIPVAALTSETRPLSEDAGRQFLALLRLVRNRQDHLAWRTLLQLRQNRLGEAAMGALYDLARELGVPFAAVLNRVQDNPSLLTSPQGSRVQAAVGSILQLVDQLATLAQAQEGQTSEDVLGVVNRTVELAIPQQDRQNVLNYLQKVVATSGTTSMSEILEALEASDDDIEQELEETKVNILTMHKAKGLTAKAVIVVAVEDEYIPGRAEGQAIGDERRLLYVSLTRAAHFLFMTYCDRRNGPQRHTGRTAGQLGRSLTRFLRDSPLTPQSGEAYVRNLMGVRT